MDYVQFLNDAKQTAENMLPDLNVVDFGEDASKSAQELLACFEREPGGIELHEYYDPQLWRSTVLKYLTIRFQERLDVLSAAIQLADTDGKTAADLTYENDDVDISKATDPEWWAEPASVSASGCKILGRTKEFHLYCEKYKQAAVQRISELISDSQI